MGGEATLLAFDASRNGGSASPRSLFAGVSSKGVGTLPSFFTLSFGDMWSLSCRHCLRMTPPCIAMQIVQLDLGRFCLPACWACMRPWEDLHKDGVDAFTIKQAPSNGLGWRVFGQIPPQRDSSLRVYVKLAWRTCRPRPISVQGWHAAHSVFCRFPQSCSLASTVPGFLKYYFALRRAVRRYLRHVCRWVGAGGDGLPCAGYSFAAAPSRDIRAHHLRCMCSVARV